MNNTDLTRFNLKSANFYLSVKTVKLDIDDFHWVVVAYNFADDCAFELPTKFTFPSEAQKLADKIHARKVINLTLWDSSDFLEYTQPSDITNEFIDCLCYDELAAVNAATADNALAADDYDDGVDDSEAEKIAEDEARRLHEYDTNVNQQDRDYRTGTY